MHTSLLRQQQQREMASASSINSDSIDSYFTPLVINVDRIEESYEREGEIDYNNSAWEPSCMFPVACSECSRRFNGNHARKIIRTVVVDSFNAQREFVEKHGYRRNALDEIYDDSYLCYTSAWEVASVRSKCDRKQTISYLPWDDIKLAYDDSNKWFPPNFSFHKTVHFMTSPSALSSVVVPTFLQTLPSTGSSSTGVVVDVESSTRRDKGIPFVPRGRLYNTIGQSFYR